MNPIEIENLTKYYGKRVGIEGLNLRVSAGSVYGFLGPNGAGKTTTIRVLLGLLRASGGRARVLGRDCWKESPRIKAEVGYLPGDLRLYPWMTGRSGLRLLGGIRRRDLKEPGGRLLERFGLPADVRVRDMSRGMRQKLGLILCLAHDPLLLILDEPTSSLDPLVQQSLFAELRERAARGNTVFFSSHNLAEVEELCDRVAILRGGKLVVEESVRELRERAGREIVIRWPAEIDGTQIAVPDFLEVRERESNVWRCGLNGAMRLLIGWAAEQPVADMSIGPPELDQMFARYYQRSDGTS